MSETLIAGRFRLAEKLGSGGMAEVYKAVDEVLGRTVAIKVMKHGDRDASFTERFSREARVLAQLGSPRIVTVYDWGQDDDLHYIVMEHIEGRDLKTAIREDGPLDSQMVAGIGAQVCEALSIAHASGVIHRDITPSNIMLLPDGSVKLTDFGIAKMENAAVTQTGTVFGTAHYFAPEQAQGLPPGPTADIYSLGIVLFEASTGRLPFDGDSPVAVAMKQVNEEPPSPRSVHAAVDPRLESVILKAMAKSPEDRYQSAAEMQADLLGLASGDSQGDTAILPAVTPARSPAGALRERTRRLVPWFLLAAGIVLLGLAVASNRLGDSVRVPDVKGQTLEEASARLRTSGLKPGRMTRSPNKEFAKGKVFRQSPPAGSRADRGTAVALSVSTGDSASVPDLIGKTESEGRVAIQAAGLVASRKSREYSSRFGEGTIIGQQPSPGEQASIGSTIQYVVSAGRPPEGGGEGDDKGKSEDKGKSDEGKDKKD